MNLIKHMIETLVLFEQKFVHFQHISYLDTVDDIYSIKYHGQIDSICDI